MEDSPSMPAPFNPVPWDAVAIRPGVFQHRSDLNRAYLVGLSSANLLQNYYLEAGLWHPRQKPDGCHWGWESPTCQLRGHFLGHWLSAAAKIYAATGDAEIKGKADRIVSELGRCQRENGGGGGGSVPQEHPGRGVGGEEGRGPHLPAAQNPMGPRGGF